MPRYKDLGTFIRDIARVGLFCSVPLVVVIMYLHSPVQSLCHPVFGCAPAVFDFCWFGFGCHANKALSGTETYKKKGMEQRGEKPVVPERGMKFFRSSADPGIVSGHWFCSGSTVLTRCWNHGRFWPERNFPIVWFWPYLFRSFNFPI